MFRKNGRDIILERIYGSAKVSSCEFSVVVVGKGDLLLQLVSGRQLVDFFGDEVVFDHLTTRKLCVFQGRFELFNMPLQSLALILWKSWVSRRGSCAWLPHTYSLFLPLILFDLSSLCFTHEDSFLEGEMEGFELYPEKFLRLFDSRRFGTGFRGV